MAGEDGVTVQEVVGIARVVELVEVENIFVQGGGMLWSAVLSGGGSGGGRRCSRGVGGRGRIGGGSDSKGGGKCKFGGAC